ncbi:hypothetical protein LPJ53_004943 [Coemansia erecta]|uniref:Uncharacterized protein n=1 Tax=Coemansia erecta TaxID=147472 RepID=A0A9W7XYP4_9FUNG|nr:hypothetical protein LPJ53_004943 [Coemansia erecta]
MQIFATLLIAASAVLAQQVGSSSDGKGSSGPSAVSHPNESNGWQAQNTLFSNGNSGGNVFSGLQGNTFDSSVSNFAFDDNNAVNPPQSQTSGNTRSTANDAGNHIGDVIPGAPQVVGLAAPFLDNYAGFHKRDIEFNNLFNGQGYGHFHEVYPELGYLVAVAGGYPRSDGFVVVQGFYEF